MHLRTYFAPRMRKNRKLWGRGPWTGEPDCAVFHHAGLHCAVIRANLGHWCGYVLVPEGHPWHGVDKYDLDVEVHGDVSFAERARLGDWQVGFDCGHFYDYTPSAAVLATLSGGAHRRVRRLYARHCYRTMQYAIAETRRLAKQAREASV